MNYCKDCKYYDTIHIEGDSNFARAICYHPKCGDIVSGRSTDPRTARLEACNDENKSPRYFEEK